MLKTKQVVVSQAIQNELEKIPKWKVLIYLQENKEASAYSLSKEFGWNPSKMHAVIKQLEKSKAIKSRIAFVNGRAVKLISLF